MQQELWKTKWVVWSLSFLPCSVWSGEHGFKKDQCASEDLKSSRILIPCLQTQQGQGRCLWEGQSSLGQWGLVLPSCSPPMQGLPEGRKRGPGIHTWISKHDHQCKEKVRSNVSIRVMLLQEKRQELHHKLHIPPRRRTCYCSLLQCFKPRISVTGLIMWTSKLVKAQIVLTVADWQLYL